ncbi:MAG: AraC family ligand binding domain-containing protein [Oscillospiraceae bacterium]
MAVPFPKCEGMQGEFYLTVDDKLHEHIAPLSDDLPLSVYTQSYRHAAREHIPLHWHSDVQLTWVYEGLLDYTIEGERLTLTPDDLLLVNAERLHGSRTVQGDTRTLCINFTPELFRPRCFGAISVRCWRMQPFLMPFCRCAQSGRRSCAAAVRGRASRTASLYMNCSRRCYAS